MVHRPSGVARRPSRLARNCLVHFTKMLQVDADHLVLSFPNVHHGAALRLDFRAPDRPDRPVALVAGTDGGFRLSSPGRVVLHLRPDAGGSTSPFAVVLSVGGANALTGVAGSTRLARPQNYFVTPPQGGIDGYFSGGRVRPFVACAEEAEGRLPLDIDVIPVKADAYDYATRGRRMCGAGYGWGTTFELPGGGERQCEPVYEDIFGLGDWDDRRRERLAVWLHAPG